MWVTDVALVSDEMGAVVTKLSPEGEVLMTLGTPGVVGEGLDTFDRPSSVAVAPNGEILVTGGEGPNSRNNPGVRRGIYIGSALTGEVAYFIPDPDLDLADQTRISGALGVLADATDSVVYAADVAPWQLRKYMRR